MTLKIEAATRLMAARAKMQTSKYAHDEVYPAIFGSSSERGDIETYVEGMQITFHRGSRALIPELEADVKSSCNAIKSRVEGNERYIEGTFYDGASESEWIISVFAIKSERPTVTVSVKRKDGLATTRYEEQED